MDFIFSIIGFLLVVVYVAYIISDVKYVNTPKRIESKKPVKSMKPINTGFENVSTPKEIENQKLIESMRPIYTDVIDVALDNRQKHIDNCQKNQPLTIIKEKRNNYEINAVAVYSNGKRIGYLNRSLASKIAEEMGNGTKFFGFVNEVTVGEGDSLGINIMLTTSPTDCVTKPTKKPEAKANYIQTSDDSHMIYVKTSSIENKTDDSFYGFVTGIPKDELLDVFLKEYYVLLGNSDLNHYRGRNGGKEFIGTILLWIYSNKKLKDSNGDNETYALLNLYLADVIGCAYNNMPPVEWSDRLEAMIRHTKVIEYSEFSEVYRYIEENFEDILDNFDFVVTVHSQRREFEKRYSQFTMAYNKLNTSEEKIEFFTKQGLGFNKYIWFNNDERNSNSRENDSRKVTIEESAFGIKYSREINSIRDAVSPMLSYRKGEPFSNFELMLGIMAFHTYIQGLNNKEFKSQTHKNDYARWYYGYGNNHTARASSIYLIDTISRYPSVVNKTKKLYKSFDIDNELYWAKLAMDAPGWSTSLTRSVILITRGLAYQHSRRIDSPPPDKIIYDVTFMGTWAMEYFELDDVLAIIDDLMKFDYENLTWTPT